MASTDRGQQPRRRARHEGGGTREAAVTIKDVAKTAGVSTATVSRVLTGGGSRVSSATCRRVLRTAQELGYRPHRGARALVRQRSGVIGMLLVRFGNDFVGGIMDGLASAARDSGREALFASYGADGPNGLRQALDHLLETRPEGIVLYPATSLPIEDLDLVAELERVPTVLVDLAVDGLDLPLVTTDDADGVRQGVDHLVSMGHARIAHLAGPSWTSTGMARLRGFREAMAAHGLRVPENWLVRYDFSYAQAVTATQSLLQTRPLPSAIIAADDRGAAALLDVARHAGVRVPDDLSVIGFSDLELSRVCHPPLTTVRQPREELGMEAVRLLVALIEGDTSTAYRGAHLLPTQLCIRGSCGPPAGQQEAPM